MLYGSHAVSETISEFTYGNPVKLDPSRIERNKPNIGTRHAKNRLIRFGHFRLYSWCQLLRSLNSSSKWHVSIFRYEQPDRGKTEW